MQTIKKKINNAPKQPEQEIMAIARMTSDFASKYRKQLIIAAAAVVALLVLMGGFELMKSEQEQKASTLSAIAYNYYSPPSGSNADYGKALDLFRDIQIKYPGTMSGAIAQYYVGNCLVNLGRPQDALNEYALFLKKYSQKKDLAGFVYQKMGYVYESMNKLDEARHAFEKAEDMLGTGVATVELARLYDAAGNRPEADKKYKAVFDKLMGTTWAMEASSRVQKLSPAPPSPVNKEAK
jgi:tetratricopeptide (TPR) repeat protein